MLAAGSVLLATSAFAGRSHVGGTFTVAEQGPGLSMDPQVTYYTTTWGLEYATAAKLFNFPDARGAAGARIVPEVAAGYTVSKDGRTYTFPIRKGYRFSDGTKVTAKSFVYAFKRVLSPKLQSPGAQFIQDPAGTYVTSYKAQGGSFVVHLRRPDETFMVKLTFPFFQATSTKLPLDHEVVTVTAANQIPTVGPYMLTYNDPNTTTQIRRNPYYRGPRPHHLDGVTLYWNQQIPPHGVSSWDERGVAPQEQDALAARFGINQARFWVKPAACTGYIGLNTRYGVFRDVQMRKAFNWAIDRKAYAAQAGLAAFPWTHLLPPNFPGSIMKRELQPYSVHPNYVKAKKLAAGHFGSGKITVVYRASGVVGPAQKEVVAHDLQQLGFKPQDVKWLWGDWEIGPPDWNGNWWDMEISTAWCQDYPDPYDFFIPRLLKSDFPGYINSAKWRRRIRTARKLVGPVRLKTFGKLDIQLMNQYAPVAVTRTYNNLSFFSNRVDPRSLRWKTVYGDWDYAAIRLK